MTPEEVRSKWDNIECAYRKALGVAKETRDQKLARLRMKCAHPGKRPGTEGRWGCPDCHLVAKG